MRRVSQVEVTTLDSSVWIHSRYSIVRKVLSEKAKGLGCVVFLIAFYCLYGLLYLVGAFYRMQVGGADGFYGFFSFLFFPSGCPVLLGVMFKK